MNQTPAPPAPDDRPSPARYLPIPTVKPRITYVILAINIIVFALESITGADVWFSFGAKINASIVAGEWWRLITPMFLHAGLAHIAFNSYALYSFGPQVEAVFGYRRFLFIEKSKQRNAPQYLRIAGHISPHWEDLISRSILTTSNCSRQRENGPGNRTRTGPHVDSLGTSCGILRGHDPW